MQLLHLPALGIPPLEVPVAQVRLITEKRGLTSYVWRDIGGHQFCPRGACPRAALRADPGGTSMLRPGHPGDRVSVNARCIENIDVFTLDVRRYDGRNDMPPGPLP